MSTAIELDKSAVEIERELTQATDDYLRGKIKLDELSRLEEKYRPRRDGTIAPSHGSSVNHPAAPARSGPPSGQRFI